MGANGSGKTTLLHLMGGLLRPSEGEVTIDEKNAKRLKLHQLAGKVGIVFQNPDLLLQAETVKNEVEFGPKNLKLKYEILQNRIIDTLANFRLVDFAEDAPYSLSRGQRQRVAVAATFSLHPDLFLLDEPTTGQDAKHLHQLMEHLCNEIRQKNKTLIFATHNIQLTLKYADRVLLLCEGELIFDGTSNTAFTDPELLQKASLMFE
jgi:energy-coupling factor transport system ATP-binding protein